MKDKRKKVLFIDDKQFYFDMLAKAFEKYDYFELVNNKPIYDRGSSVYIDRELQKKRIIELLRTSEYDVVLFDLSLRSDREQTMTAGMAENLLSIEIYQEVREELKKANKMFVFITAHNNWKTESAFKEIGEKVRDAIFLRKPTEEEEKFCNCVAYDKDGNSKCGETFQGCDNVSCFNKVLWRLMLDE